MVSSRSAIPLRANPIEKINFYTSLCVYLSTNLRSWQPSGQLPAARDRVRSAALTGGDGESRRIDKGRARRHRWSHPTTPRARGAGRQNRRGAAPMTHYSALLQPFRLRHLKLRNRIMSTSHEPAYAEDGRPGLRYRLYHAEKARGGIALTMIGGSAVVAPDSPPAFGNLHLFDERIVPDLQALADAVHAHGAAVMCQITHLGRRTYWNRADWLPVLAPSPVREPAHRSFPKAMEEHDIRRVVRAYGAAARRCREGGLDGIEIEAYGHLLDAFWSPATNRRTDAYGGSLENRMRFSLEVLDEI